MKNIPDEEVIEKIAKLKSLVFQFGKECISEKTLLLSWFIKHSSDKPNQCKLLHHVLLAMLAYPDNNKLFSLTQSALSTLIDYIENNSSLQNKLGGAGFYSTTSDDCNFSYPMTRYIVKKFPGDVFIHNSTAHSENIKAIFKILLPSVEYAGIHEDEKNLKERISLFNTGNKLTDIEWLLQLLDLAIPDEKTKELIYHQLEIFIRGKISRPQYSISLLRGHAVPLYFQNKPLKKKIVPESLISKKLPKPVKLNTNDKLQLIDAAKLTLFYLYSETEPFVNANEEDITLFALENGISIALFGSKTEKRYSLESYIGYLVLKNNIPVAYGGGWMFGERCQFGINILEAFRGGESGLIFCELLRVYHQYFGATSFVVKPYQFGKNNPDGLKAGAFWFYYNFGFRPENLSLQKLASEESAKKEKNISYKSDLATLRKFTKSNLQKIISKNSYPSFDTAEISKKITAFINTRYDGNRKKAIDDCFTILTKSLSENPKKWKKEDINYAKNVSLLFCMRPGSKDWIRRNKKNILQFILLKSAKTERPWIKHLQDFDAFWERMEQNF